MCPLLFGRFAEAALTVLPNRVMDVCGRKEPCTFRPSSFGFASRCRWAIMSMIGGFAGSAGGINAESSSSLWWRENANSLSGYLIKGISLRISCFPVIYRADSGSRLSYSSHDAVEHDVQDGPLAKFGLPTASQHYRG